MHRCWMPDARVQLACRANASPITVGGNPFTRELLGDGVDGQPLLDVHLKNALHECRFLWVGLVDSSMIEADVTVAQWDGATPGVAGLRTSSQATHGPFQDFAALVF